MSDIIKFLRHEGPDFKGRMLKDMWKFDNEQLETSHDVIQWFFPSDIPSKHHSAAPVLTEEQVNTMWRDEIIRSSIRQSCLVFAQFLGSTQPSWITPRNHNFLRITRVMRCLWNMRMGPEFVRWREVCRGLYEKHGDVIGYETFRYWMDAHDDELMKP